MKHQPNQMKLEKLDVKIIISILLLFTALIGLTILPMASFEEIYPYSPLVLLVDKEVTRAPAPNGSKLISYRSEPTEGTKQGVSEATFRLYRQPCDCEAIRAYIHALGYRSSGKDSYDRGDDSIVLNTMDGHLYFIKYSWD